MAKANPKQQGRRNGGRAVITRSQRPTADDIEEEDRELLIQLKGMGLYEVDTKGGRFRDDAMLLSAELVQAHQIAYLCFRW